MSFHNHFLEDAERCLRQAERDMQRHMRLMDLHLHQLRDRLPASCPRSRASHPCCLCQPDPFPWERRALTMSPDMEQELDSIERRLNRLLDSSNDHELLALVDVQGFDPKEITVTVKDGKVKVSAEHREEHSTKGGKECNYRKMMKEMSLPQGVSGDEVTYSLGPNNIMKIKVARKDYPSLLSP